MTRLCNHITQFLLPLLCRRHSNYSSLSSDTLVATRISERLADIHKWTTAHRLKLNLHKTELLFMLGKDCPHMDLQVTVEGIAVSPSPTARNFGVVQCVALPTLPQWPLSTTSTGSSPSSRGKQHSSWSKHSSSSASTTATLSWLDFLSP